MANPTDNSSTPTGASPITNASGMNQQFVVWSNVWPGVCSKAPWLAYLAAIPASGQLIK